MISQYHSQVGRQGRSGAGYQGMRYDQPLSTFVSRPMMEPEDDLAEPVAQKTLEGDMTPLDVVKSLLVEQPVEQDAAEGSSPAGLPAGADPVSSGDPDSIGYGSTVEGDRGQTPMEGVTSQIATDAVDAMTTGMLKSAVLSPVLDAFVPPMRAMTIPMKWAMNVPKYLKTYKTLQPPQTKMLSIADEGEASVPDDVVSDMFSHLETEPYHMQVAEMINNPPVSSTGSGMSATGQGSGSTHGFGATPGSVSGEGFGSEGGTGIGDAGVAGMNPGDAGLGGPGAGGGMGGAVGPGEGGGGGGTGVGGVGW